MLHYYLLTLINSEMTAFKPLDTFEFPRADAQVTEENLYWKRLGVCIFNCMKFSRIAFYDTFYIYVCFLCLVPFRFQRIWSGGLYPFLWTRTVRCCRNLFCSSEWIFLIQILYSNPNVQVLHLSAIRLLLQLVAC